MFLRSVTGEWHDGSHREPGVFHAAGKLRDGGSLSPAEEVLVQEIRGWCNGDLEKLKRFPSAKPPCEGKRQKAISWFNGFSTLAYPQNARNGCATGAPRRTGSHNQDDTAG